MVFFVQLLMNELVTVEVRKIIGGFVLENEPNLGRYLTGVL
jgi:hypothetical protein